MLLWSCCYGGGGDTVCRYNCCGVGVMWVIVVI